MLKTYISLGLWWGLLLTSLSAQGQISLSVERHNSFSSSELVLSGVVDYGAILTPAHALKNSLQDNLNQSFKCGASGTYKCNEYPIAHLLGEKKFIMTESSPNSWKHPVVEYSDKRQKRSLTIPIELSREFPKATIQDFKLLNADTPGAANRAFTVQPKTLGDTLIKIVPDTNVLYVHLCQILPGGSIVNHEIAGTYTYFYKKILGHKIDLHVDFKGHLGGASFDAVKICSLTKAEIKDTMNTTTTLDILPPVAYNLQRVPLEIKISSQSWLILVLIALLLAAILMLLPGAIFNILSVVAVIVATAIAIGGAMSSKLATKYANQQVDKAIQNYLGVSVSDFNSEVWQKKLKYDALPVFKDDKINEGEFKDGSWASTLLSKNLLKDHQLLAQASVNLALEKYFAQYSLPPTESLRPICEAMERRIVARTQGIKLLARELESIQKTAARLKDVCLKVNVSVKMDMFLPLEKSRAAGCYDSFIRLEDVQDRNKDLLGYLADKLASSVGGSHRAIVAAAIKERVGEFNLVRASNWWARQDQPVFCGFDNRLTIKYSIPEEARFAACFVKELKAERDFSNGIEPLIDRVEDRCKIEIRDLSEGKV